MVNKKGMSGMSFLVTFILVLASAGVILLALGVFSPRAAVAAEENACHGSVVSRAWSSVAVDDEEINWFPITCKTQDIEISGNREEIKGQLARMMARCWWMFNEGRQDDAFSSFEVSKLLGWDDNENKCFLCYTAEIEQDEIEGGPITAPEMFRYMIEKDHYKIKGAKYIDYIQSYGGAGQISVMDSIYPNNVYGITFLSKSDDDAEFGIVDGVATGILATVVAAGVVACVIAEPCGVIAIAGGIGATGLVAGGASAGYLASHSVNVLEAKANFYDEERAVSMIVLDDLKGIEAGQCLVGDVAGE